MIRFFRENDFDIVCVQESHTKNESIINTIENQFRTKSAIWTHQCGIISPNENITITKIDTPISNERILFAKITHSQQYFEPFFVLNLYAPAGSGQVKTIFFQKLLDYRPLFNLDIIHRLFIMGDFNYSYSRQTQMCCIPEPWLTFLQGNFTDCL
ncbi:hypothetical protein EDC94DRAFT_671391, partial [Helicostylum pulchrum]